MREAVFSLFFTLSHVSRLGWSTNRHGSPSILSKAPLCGAWSLGSPKFAMRTQKMTTEIYVHSCSITLWQQTVSAGLLGGIWLGRNTRSSKLRWRMPFKHTTHLLLSPWVKIPSCGSFFQSTMQSLTIMMCPSIPAAPPATKTKILLDFVRKYMWAAMAKLHLYDAYSGSQFPCAWDGGSFSQACDSFRKTKKTRQKQRNRDRQQKTRENQKFDMSGQNPTAKSKNLEKTKKRFFKWS